MKPIELLAERHRHRVLQLGAAHLEHIGEFDRLGLKGIGEFLQRPHERRRREDHGETQRRRIGIIGRLGHIDVVDRVKKLILAAPVSQEFQREIGDDFIGIHICRSAGASLHGIDHELIEEESILGDEIAGAIDRIGLLRRQVLKAPVGARRRLLDERQGADKLGKMPDRDAGDRRLDALGMIFNRLTGLDIGVPPTFLIPENIKHADAPVRYPFLWNAWRQDFTQWPGVAENGDKILALSRNLGEVYGVFGVFHPKKDESQLLGFDYLDDNSANFQGLDALEDLIPKLGPPKWPWAVDQKLATLGKAVYERRTGQEDSCADCHGIKDGKPRLLNPNTWATPIQDVGTDSREYNIFAGTVKTGVLAGAQIPFLTQPLNPNDRAGGVEKTAVTGAILQRNLAAGLYAKVLGKVEQAATVLAPQIQALHGAFKMPAPAAPPAFAYESRVLEGIWAAAPYLHNGSVPTLAELLKPAAERAAAFKIGPAYDPVNVGLAADQSKFNYTLKTTDCSDRNSGYSRCGHEYGTKLSPDEKKALLEYLKIL
jgi:hypothetical protein